MKIKIIIISIFLCQLSLYAGNYYWYKGEKINLIVDSTKINVTTAVDVNLLESLVRFESIKEIKQLERSENNTSLFSVELISKNQYNNIIEYLKSVEDVVCISPYYGKDSNSIGTSSFFCVKLYKENDYELLNNFASQNALKIIKQVPYMPTWYILSNMDSKINSTQASNMVYESKLFADVDPLFMFNFGHNCTNDDIFYKKTYICIFNLI